MTHEREAAIAAFLEGAGWGAAIRRPLADDASFRRYDRLTAPDGGSAVLMDAPPDKEAIQPFAAIAEILAHLGFSAPRVLARNVEDGLLLLEDLGDATFAKLLRDGRADAETLYTLATDTLVELHRAWDRAAGLPHDPPPAYDMATLVDGEAMLLPDWYAPAVGVALGGTAREGYRDAWREALTPALRVPHTLVLRDYFPDNLIHLPERDGVRACGLLDFQDARVGPCAYDLMSLLQDARRDVPARIEEAMLRRYLDARPEIEPAPFRCAYRVLAAQRHAKVIGIFTRLAHRDGKPGYRQHMPRLWRLMDGVLAAEPALTPVKAWLDTYLPAERRVIPDAEAPA
jgi:hypothetical protein